MDQTLDPQQGLVVPRSPVAPTPPPRPMRDPKRIKLEKPEVEKALKEKEAKEAREAEEEKFVSPEFQKDIDNSKQALGYAFNILGNLADKKKTAAEFNLLKPLIKMLRNTVSNKKFDLVGGGRKTKKVRRS
jgi:hypothetical protein